MFILKNLNLIQDRRYGQDHFVFTNINPRTEGYKGEVNEGIELDYDMNAIHLWPHGEPRPDPQLGRDPANPKHYKVFKYPQELRHSGFDLVDPQAPIVVYSWLDYRELVPLPHEVAEKMELNEWFDILDSSEEGMKLRYKSDLDADPPPGSNRDHIAEWVAKRHMSTDGSIRQVYYLPTGAPPQEIRLLEINEQPSAPEEQPEPLDFGLEVAGLALKLSVADISKDQLEKMKLDPSNLPPGWKWEGAVKWGVRA
jgi:hypothetical protein